MDWKSLFTRETVALNLNPKHISTHNYNFHSVLVICINKGVAYSQISTAAVLQDGKPPEMLLAEVVSLLSFLLHSTVTVKPKCVAHSTTENNRSLRWLPSHKIFLLWLFGLKTYLVRRRTKTQKCKGAVFEQLESSWA